MRTAILDRVSTRTFNKQQLSKEDLIKIDSVIDKYKITKGPFDHTFDYSFKLNTNKSEDGSKVGTYGILRNVPGYIGGPCSNDFKSLVDYGYIFERMILDLTKANFDTCWVGGTFKREDFKVNLKENKIVPAITPVGYRAQKRSVVDRLLRRTVKANSRFMFNKLFKDYNSLEPLSDNYDKLILESLDLVKRGPSASNKQPWRVYVESDIMHFYIERTPNYPNDSFLYDIQALDIGIAISHFTVGLEYYGIKYSYIRENKAKQIDLYEYVLSIEIKKQ